MPLLFPFQEAGVAWLGGHLQGLLADEMGLGKTRQLVVAADNFAGGRKLVVGPATARVAWKIELRTLGIPDDLVCILNHQSDPIPAHVEWIITSFALFRVRQDLQRLAPNVIILDECQAIKNMDAKTSKAIVPSVLRSDVRWFASGTPIKNHYGEFYSLARLIIPMSELARSDLNSYAKWKAHFCIETKQLIRVKGGFLREVSSIQGSLNAPLMKEVMGPHMLRRRKREVLKDFPEMAWQPLYVELKENFQYSDEDVAAALRQAKLGINPPKGHHQTLRSQLSVAKVPHVVKAIQEHFESTEAPLVIFSFFLEPLAILAANLKKLKITCAGFSGETSPENREKYITDFQAGNLQVLLGQTLTAGVAITLTKAWRCIFLELCWSPTDNQQARDRLHRIGQTLNVLAQYVVAKGNPLDERVQEVLARKTRDLDQLETA